MQTKGIYIYTNLLFYGFIEICFFYILVNRSIVIWSFLGVSWKYSKGFICFVLKVNIRIWIFGSNVNNRSAVEFCSIHMAWWSKNNDFKAIVNKSLMLDGL